MQNKIQKKSENSLSSLTLFQKNPMDFIIGRLSRMSPELQKFASNVIDDEILSSPRSKVEKNRMAQQTVDFFQKYGSLILELTHHPEQLNKIETAQQKHGIQSASFLKGCRKIFTQPNVHKLLVTVGNFSLLPLTAAANQTSNYVVHSGIAPNGSDLCGWGNTYCAQGYITDFRNTTVIASFSRNLVSSYSKDSGALYLLNCLSVENVGKNISSFLSGFTSWSGPETCVANSIPYYGTTAVISLTNGNSTLCPLFKPSFDQTFQQCINAGKTTALIVGVTIGGVAALICIAAIAFILRQFCCRPCPCSNEV